MTGEPPAEPRDLDSARPEVRNTKVILLDELDCLLTKNQSILYNLFEWPQRKKANLIVLSVANTLDLPETFMARISSRIGNARLVFTPYSSAEIKEIITQRVREADIFDEAALNFISKKVAVISSDIRKTLAICRQAIERFLEETARPGAREDPGRISLSLVARVFEGTYSASPSSLFVLARRGEAFRERSDALFLRLPLVGRLARGYNAARFGGTLAMLAGAGVPILKALQAAAETLGNRAMRADALDALVQVREGAPLASALAGKKRFPGLLAMFARLGEQTGQLPLMLQRAATQLSGEVQRRAMAVATILEPLLIVAMGGVVMLIVLAVLLPIIQLNTWVR